MARERVRVTGPVRRRHGIIGCGRVADNHVDAVRMLGGAWSVAVACDVRVERAEKLAARHGIPEVSDCVDSVLGRPDLTSVSVLTDHASHPSLVEAALRAGKHVLVEKPLAFDTSLACDLVDLAQQCGLVLMTVSQHQYDPVVQHVRRWLSRGLLGDLVLVRGSLEAWRPADYYMSSDWHGTWQLEGGSALVNQGYHCLDVIRSLVGPLTVDLARGTTTQPGGALETEVTLAALLQAAGIPVLFSATNGSSTRWRTRIEIVGADGTVEFDIDHPASLHRATGREALVAAAAAVSDAEVVRPAPGIDYYGISHRRQIADFARSVTHGVPSAVADPREGIAMVELLGKIYRAAGMPGPWAVGKEHQDPHDVP